MKQFLSLNFLSKVLVVVALVYLAVNPGFTNNSPPPQLEEVKGDLVCPQGEITCYVGKKHCSTSDECRNKVYDGNPPKEIKKEAKKVLGTTVKKQPTNTQSPNDPVHCNIHPNCGGGTIPLTRAECANSVCCELTPGGKSVFYKDRSKCNNDAPNIPPPQPANTNSNTYNPPYYPPCTVNYLQGPSTYYYMTAEECSAAQQRVSDSFAGSNANDSYVYTEPDPPDYSFQNASCKADVRDEYSAAIQRANSYGSNSAGEAMREIAKSTADAGFAQCDSVYPL